VKNLKPRHLVVIAMFGIAIIATFPINVTLGQEDGREHWAVLAACTTEPNSPSNDTQYMYHVLNEHYDFDGIYYLDVHTDRPGVNASATRENFRWAITNWLHDNSDANDLIFIFCVGHGGGYNHRLNEMEFGRIDGSQGDTVDEGTEHIINDIWQGVDECIIFDPVEQYWDDELATDLNLLDCSRLAFVRVGCAEEGTEGCFNGGLIDDISAPNRIIMTASNETSHCFADLDGDGFCEWSEVFIDALHGEDTSWDATTDELVHTGNEIDADSDDDGCVSLWEAWEYAWNHDDARLSGLETPWFDDDGDGFLPCFVRVFFTVKVNVKVADHTPNVGILGWVAIGAAKKPLFALLVLFLPSI